jgi:hypothetical protein
VRRPRRVRVGTVNLRWGMTEAELEAAGRKISRRLDVAGYQELRSTATKTAVRRGLPAGKRKPWGWRDGGECPQSFRKKRLRVVPGSVEVHQAVTPGLARVTPALPITRVVYRHAKDHSIRFSVLATHLVPLTLHGRPRVDHADWRAEHWEAHWVELGRIARADHADGLPVVIVLDGNNIHLGEEQIRALHPDARIVAHHGIDAVILIPGASCKVRRLRKFTFATGSDHKAAGATLLLTGVGQ